MRKRGAVLGQKRRMTLAKRAKLAKEEQRGILSQRRRDAKVRTKKKSSLSVRSLFSSGLRVSASPRLCENISSGSYLGELGALVEIIPRDVSPLTQGDGVDQP